MVTTALEPNLLPAAAHELADSTDVPSPAGVRPFGLTHTTVVPDDVDFASLDGLTYDPARQVNVDANGEPATSPDHIIRMATHTDTKYDNQWFVDKD